MDGPAHVSQRESLDTRKSFVFVVVVVVAGVFIWSTSHKQTDFGTSLAAHECLRQSKKMVRRPVELYLFAWLVLAVYALLHNHVRPIIVVPKPSSPPSEKSEHSSIVRHKALPGSVSICFRCILRLYSGGGDGALHNQTKANFGPHLAGVGLRVPWPGRLPGAIACTILPAKVCNYLIIPKLLTHQENLYHQQYITQQGRRHFTNQLTVFDWLAVWPTLLYFKPSMFSIQCFALLSLLERLSRGDHWTLKPSSATYL